MERQLQKYFILSILFIHVDKYLNNVGNLAKVKLVAESIFSRLAELPNVNLRKVIL